MGPPSIAKEVINWKRILWKRLEKRNQKRFAGLVQVNLCCVANKLHGTKTLPTKFKAGFNRTTENFGILEFESPINTDASRVYAR